MKIEAIVDFWEKQTKPIEGKWVHPEDAEALLNQPHSFNLDYPISIIPPAGSSATFFGHRE